jgi:hypothetical protein
MVTLTAAMNIGLTNVFVESPDGELRFLTSANAAAVGKVSTNGAK